MKFILLDYEKCATCSCNLRFFLCVRIRKYVKSNNKKIAEHLLTAKIIGYQNKLIEVFAVNMLY